MPDRTVAEPGRPTDPGSPVSRREWLAAGGALLAAVAVCRPGVAGASLASARRVGPDEAAIERWLRLANVPGMTMATVHGGQIAADGFGVRRAGRNDRVDADTVFEAASLSKPVFAVIAMQLAREGVLDLDRPVSSYLALPNPSDERARSITATHLLSHSSGWRNWRGGRDLTLTSEFEPGSRFSYSGEGYYFLQRVVETLTGKGLDRLAREHVFEPLGMRRSGYVWRRELDAALATPHTGRGDPMNSHNVRMGRAYAALASEIGTPVDDWTGAEVEKVLPRVDAKLPVLPNFMVPNAAASLLTTARDYATFVRWLLGAGDPRTGRAVLGRMIAPRVTINEALGWGSGIGLEQLGARRFAWHWGDNPGFKNFVVLEPASGDAMVVFTNGNAGQRVYERVIRASTSVDHPAFLWL